MQNSDGSRAVLVTSICSDDVVCSYDFVESTIIPPYNTRSYYYQDIENVTKICDQDYVTYSELHKEMVLPSVYLQPKFAKSSLVSNFKFSLVDNETNICCSSEFDVNNDDSSDDEMVIGKIYLQQE